MEAIQKQLRTILNKSVDFMIGSNLSDELIQRNQRPGKYLAVGSSHLAGQLLNSLLLLCCDSLGQSVVATQLDAVFYNLAWSPVRARLKPGKLTLLLERR